MSITSNSSRLACVWHFIDISIMCFRTLLEVLNVFGCFTLTIYLRWLYLEAHQWPLQEDIGDVASEV